MELAVKNINMMLQQDITNIKKCQTEEELLMALWQVQANYNHEEEEIIKLVQQKRAEFNQIKLMKHKDAVITKLTQALTHFGDTREFIELIAHNEGIEVWDIVNILDLEQQLHQDNKAYVNCLQQLQILMNKAGVQYTEMDMMKAKKIETSKMILTKYFQSGCLSTHEFCEQTKCPVSAFSEAVTILRNIDDKLYHYYNCTKSIDTNDEITKKEEKLRRKKILREEIRNSSEEEIYRILLDGKDIDRIKAFCDVHRLKLPLVQDYLSQNRVENAKVLAGGDIFEKQIILAEYCKKLETLFNSVVDEISDITKIETENKCRGNNQPAPMLNLYDFYDHYHASFNQFLSVVRICNFDSQKSAIIRNYRDKHEILFEQLKDVAIRGRMHTGIMSCDGHVLTFRSVDVINAHKDIKENGKLPYRGLVYQAIERQKLLREGKINPDDQPKIKKK